MKTILLFYYYNYYLSLMTFAPPIYFLNIQRRFNLFILSKSSTITNPFKIVFSHRKKYIEKLEKI